MDGARGVAAFRPTSAVGDGEGTGEGVDGDDLTGDGDGDGDSGASCTVALKFVAPASPLETPWPPQLALQLLLLQHVAGTPDARASFWATPGSSRSNSISV